MKSFFKMVLASLVGITLAGIIGFFFIFITFGLIGSAISSAETIRVKPNSIFRIMLDSPVAERSKSGQIQVSFTSFSLDSKIGLNDILKTIHHAAEDPNINLIYMDLSTLQVNMAHVDEIRSALERFKESGKPIIAYGDNFSQAAYYLATVADKIYLNPYGSSSLTGLRAEVMFYKGLLDKLQVDMQIIRHGKFKSAIEPFVMDRMSPENREQYMSFINSIWGHWVSKICQARHIEEAQLNKWMNNLELETAQKALDKGLVDGLLFKDELLAELCKLTGVASDDKLTMIDVPEYAKVPMRQKAGRDRIAIVYADGDILMGKGLDDITAWNMANTLRSVRLNKNIKAVVLRVNSPGGSSQASEIIARELMLLKQEKTLVVSMGNYAASGGYWIALPADKIIANPTSLTGSIGVFSIIPNVKKGLNNHLGITVDVAKSNESADYPSIMRPLTTREQEAMQEMVEFIYAEFVGKVSAARELSTTRVDEIGQGRVWSGIDAVRLGLVDELGGITEAIEAAAVLAGIDEYRVLELPSMRTPFEQMLESLRNGSISIKAELPEQAKTMESFLKEVDRPGVYARLPHDVKVY